MKRFAIFLFGIFLSAISYADTCTQSQIDLGNGDCIDTKFSLTTSATDSFQFVLSAVGTFYVDCGNDGTLTGTGVSGSNTITRSDTTLDTYTCSWDDADTQTVRFAGAATGYSTDNTTAAIRFNISDGSDTNAAKITTISGSLGAIFSSLDSAPSGTEKQPKFYRTFYRALSLQSIPENLFLGVSGATYKMFDSTFYWTGITSIPENLFQNITDGYYDLFQYTFAFCTSLRSIPSGLFRNITRPHGWMFVGTFAGSGITSIPEDLFSSITGVYSTRTSIFSYTFGDCKSLTSIPANLFATISSGGQTMFNRTFENCTNITGYIPPSTFSGLIANNSPTGTDMWKNTFSGTRLATTCPTGTRQYITGYEDYWNGKVSCVDESFVCDAGEYFPAHGYQCETCPLNSACSGGTYNYSETITQGLQNCASGTPFAPTGSAVCYPHILHVGNDNIYLKSTKQTTPSLNLKIGNDIFYANMTTTRTRMNKDSTHYLHIRLDNNDYYVCDDTICPQ